VCVFVGRVFRLDAAAAAYRLLVFSIGYWSV